MDLTKLKKILEAVLLATERSLSVVQLEALFELDEERPTRDEIRKALHEMEDDFENRGFELKHVASGFRLQVKQEYATWVGRLWDEKPARYTRALLETMALIAYRQPITRGEIEEVRGVSVSSNIIKTLLERDWIKVLGHKDVPGKPTLYGTTKEFLDYFNLQKLDQLPTLAEIKDLDSIHPELELDEDAPESSTDDAADSDTDTSEAQQNKPDNNDTTSLTDTGETTAQSEAAIEEAVSEEATVEEITVEDTTAEETVIENHESSEVNTEEVSASDEPVGESIEEDIEEADAESRQPALNA